MFGCLRSHPLLSLLIRTDIFSVRDFAIPTSIDLSYWHLSYDYPHDRELISFLMVRLSTSFDLYDIIKLLNSDSVGNRLLQSCSISNSTSSIWNSPSMISDLFSEISKLANKASTDESVSDIKNKLGLIHSITSYP